MFKFRITGFVSYCNQPLQTPCPKPPRNKEEPQNAGLRLQLVKNKRHHKVHYWISFTRQLHLVRLITSEREARSEFFCLRNLICAARPDPTRPDPTRPDPTRPDPTQPNPTRPRDAFEKLIALERIDRFTSSLLCSMSPFNKFRI